MGERDGSEKRHTCAISDSQSTKVPMIASSPKKPSLAAPAGASGVRSRPATAPMTSGPILSGDGDRISGTTWTRFGLDSRRHHVLGKEGRYLGQEKCWPHILRHLRIRRSVRGVVFKPLEHPQHAHTRLCQVRPSEASNGSPAPGGSVIQLATQVSNQNEVQWLRALRKEIDQSFAAPRIDLLEVYAQPNSRLAEEVIKQGGKLKDSPKNMGICPFSRVKWSCSI